MFPKLHDALQIQNYSITGRFLEINTWNEMLKLYQHLPSIVRGVDSDIVLRNERRSLIDR